MALTYSDDERRRRIQASNARARKEKRAAIINDYKRALGCSGCPERDPAVLDFHHLDPATKLFTVADRLHRLSLPQLLQEIERCTVLCANCHRRKHAAR